MLAAERATKQVTRCDRLQPPSAIPGAAGISKGPRFFRKDLTMRTFAERVVNFLKREDGPTAVEYAVMLALIIVVCITAITALGTNANKTFTNVSNNLANVGS